jgi:hypothetical protein
MSRPTRPALLNLPRSRPWVVLVAALLLGCGSFGATSAPTVPLDSGIRGTVQLGPTCPVQDRDVPCVTPYVAVLVILDSDQREVARVSSGVDGAFQVALAPGDYTVTPTPGGDPFPTAAPQAVTVLPGAFTEIEVNYDTGIR